VAAVDISATQLAFARELAGRHNVEIPFYQGDMADLSPIETGSQDVVFSAFALNYVDDLGACFREVRRVLRDEGVFVWSVPNPYFEMLDGKTLRPVRSYFDTGKVVEGWDDAPFATNRRKLSDYLNEIVSSGFVVERVLEPDSRRRHAYDPWYGLWELTPELMALIPPTIIFRCGKDR
jgi:ubiquinone/menaquinone biosynthesis C-methylase UbiE